MAVADGLRVSEPDVDWREAVVQLYLGQLDVVVLRSQFPRTYLQGLAERFWSLPPHRREPPAAAFEVGTHHFGRGLNDYLEQAAATSAELASVAAGPGADLLSEFQAQVAEALARHDIELRRARHGDASAAPFVIRSWATELDDRRYDLAPHDDAAQLDHPAQAGFEIQRVPRDALIATNIVIDRHHDGALVIWPVAPSADDRARLQVEHDAYPYPDSFLEVDPVVIAMEPGDVSLFRGRFVHAITTSPRRVVASYFSGLVSPREAVYWS